MSNTAPPLGVDLPAASGGLATLPLATAGTENTRSALPSLAVSQDASSNQAESRLVAAKAEPVAVAATAAVADPSPVAGPSAMDPIAPAASATGGGSLDPTDDRYAPPALSAAQADGAPGPHRVGVGLQVGGGVAGFFSAPMRQMASTGGYWDARLAVGLKQLFALEIAYVGAAHPLTAAGVGGGATLIGNGAEGNLRLNIPMLRRRTFVTSYALAGLGWMHYQVSGSWNDGTTVARKDDMAVIPVGAGLTMGYGQFYVDTRFVYRFTAFEDLVRDPARSSSQLGQSTFGASVGVVF